MSKLAGVSSKSPGLGVAPPPTILAQPQTSIHTFFLFSDHRLSLSLSLSLWQSVCSEHANYGPWSFDSVTGKFHGEVEYGREREWSIWWRGREKSIKKEKKKKKKKARLCDTTNYYILKFTVAKGFEMIYFEVFIGGRK